MSSLITAVTIITELREPERDQTDFIVTNIIFLLWRTREIYIVVFPPHCDTSFLCVSFVPVWKSLLGPFVYLGETKFLLSSLQIKYLVICGIINPKTLFLAGTRIRRISIT